MPEIGEKRRASDIWGGNNNHYLIWQPCIECQQPRWTLLVKGSPKSLRCDSCANKHAKKPHTGITKVCPVCSKIFYVFKCLTNSHIYCSVSCYNISQTKNKPLYCIVCGKEYHRHPAQIKWRGSSFCSNKCKGLYYRTLTGANSHSWQGGKSKEYKCIRNSAAFREWRNAIFNRDDYTCQQCGARSKAGQPITIYPHHIKSFTYYPELRFDINNGLTVCGECHKLLTAWQILSKEIHRGKWSKNKIPHANIVLTK
jgi:hypothetical protein